MTITDDDRAAAEAWLDETGGCGCGICLKQSAEFLAHHRQAAFNAGLERAAVIAEQRAAMYQGKAAKKDPLAEDCMNLSEGFRLCAEASEWAASDIRAEKEKPQ